MRSSEQHKWRANPSERLKRTMVALKNILSDAVINFQNNGNTNHAAAIAFYSLLSIVPLALLTALMASSFLGSYADIYLSFHKWLRYYQPGSSLDVFAGAIDQIGDNIRIIGSFALLTTLWFSSFVFGAIETAFNTIFRSRQIRNYIVSKVLATAMIPLCWLIASGLVFANYFADMLFKHPLFTKTYIVYPFIQTWLFPVVLPFVIACILFALIYKLMPTNKIGWGSALVGGAVFCLLLNLAKGLFAWYVANFCAYGVIFGGLEKMIILLIWFFYVAFIFLFCAELIASYERHDLLLIEKALMAKHDNGAVQENLLFRRFGRLYKRGACIFVAGEKSFVIYYIMSGTVILTRNNPSGTLETGQTLGMGNFFGGMEALTGEPLRTSAYAVADSAIASIDATTLRHLIRANEEIAMSILRQFAQNTGEALARANSLVSAQEKMAWVSFFAAHPGVTAAAALTNAESTGEQVARQEALVSLQREGILFADTAGRLFLAGSD